MLFFSLILYHPGFYSSLSDEKQRNGGSLNIPTILVKFALHGYRNEFYFINLTFLERFWPNLPISETFWKCCHFFVFHRSVSCKSKVNRELIRKNDDTLTINNVKDFFITF